MKSKFKIESRKFRKALKQYASVVKNKTVPEILNDKTPHVIMKAMRATPKAGRAKITADLGSPGSPSQLAQAIVLKRAKKAGVRLSRAQAQVKATKMIRARMASVRYISLGWLPALAKWRAVQKPLNKKSTAARDGYGKRATTGRHETVFGNAAPGVLSIGTSALKQALDQEAASTAAYARRKMQTLANRYNRR